MEFPEISGMVKIGTLEVPVLVYCELTTLTPVGKSDVKDTPVAVCEEEFVMVTVKVSEVPHRFNEAVALVSTKRLVSDCAWA